MSPSCSTMVHMSTTTDITWTILPYKDKPGDPESMYRSARATLAPGIVVSAHSRCVRPSSRYRQTYSDRQGGRPSNSRIYFHIENESVLENLCNRTSRPTRAWAKILRERVLPLLGIEGKVRWNQYAGCSCPCSPAFVIDGKIERAEIDGKTSDHLIITRSKDKGPWSRFTPYSQVDLWVSIDAAMLGVPETEDPEKRAARTEAVARSVVADPTLDTLVGGPEGRAEIASAIQEVDIQRGLAEMIGAQS